MSKELFVALSVALVILLLAVGWLGWRSRGRRQRDIPAPERPRIHVATLVVPVLYIATTRAGDPYDRVTVHGLGFRARGELRFGDDGVVIALPKDDILVRRTAIEVAERATWTIDRVVEPGGLLRFTWKLGATRLDTYVRVTGDDSDALAALRSFAESAATGREEDHPHPTGTGAAA